MYNIQTLRDFINNQVAINQLVLLEHEEIQIQLCLGLFSEFNDKLSYWYPHDGIAKLANSTSKAFFLKNKLQEFHEARLNGTIRTSQKFKQQYDLIFTEMTNFRKQLSGDLMLHFLRILETV